MYFTEVIGVFLKWAKSYGPLFRLWLGNQAYIFVADPKIAEVITFTKCVVVNCMYVMLPIMLKTMRFHSQQVLTSKVHIHKAHEYDLLHPFLGNGLSTLNGTYTLHAL
jgi:hypothetical protein